MNIDASWWVAVAWLGILGVATTGYFIHLVRRSDYGYWESCLYLPTYLMGRLVWRVHFTNNPPPALSSGAILVANHRSSVDPFFVQLAARRRVHWMVAKEYCDHFLFGLILKAVQAIPTNRNGMDTASTKAAMRLTKEGRLVGMFPEGRLNHTSNPLISIRSGAAAVAIRSGVPIIPLYIDGSPYRRTVWSPLFMAAHVGITFGRPIYPAEYQDNAEGYAASDAMILAWAQELLKLANQPDFPVQLSAKRRRVRDSITRT
ncbi:lysophospholipid acyltransferase family protein [Aureliella helgolandensis]|uniref:1-acyl-sn-glycerol-3-phosphate acyltransferase n=1 Tax=Aureliella helgolandensis TaxID=2527968 RepID=A0A518G8A2_9BACT|nr:lysophospholipid acyltransferase family protein [Aureliella helgolandensis]QDV24816.1 1-acyl-sn-glycerol-3-phosphate acyltransferase [Aureliella helgolandensis]